MNKLKKIKFAEFMSWQKSSTELVEFWHQCLLLRLMLFFIS